LGKRSDFERRPRDLYKTRDPRATAALAPFLKPMTRYVEPCAGDGALIALLGSLGHICIAASDIEPLAPGIQGGDARQLRRLPAEAECFITNPPWERSLLHAILAHLMRLGPTWALFDASWAFSAQAAPLLRHCEAIVAVGRLRWMLGEPEDKGDDPKDDCAWYRFHALHLEGPRFYGRGAK
jgi:hypothetical protein